MKIRNTIKYILLAIFVIALGYFSTMIFSSHPAQKETATIANEKNGGKVLGEEGSASSSAAEADSRMYTSQNFHSPQITFGGDAISVPSGEQAVAPEILDMRSELLTTKTDQQVKFLLSWKTNKLCASSIAYAKEGQAEEKTVSEDSYGFLHSVEIAPLNYATSYSYVVSARDKWGNETKSEKLAFYSGAPSVSIFDIISDAFKEMFGWAWKK